MMTTPLRCEGVNARISTAEPNALGVWKKEQSCAPAFPL